MSWILPAVIASLCGTILLALTYYYFYHYQKERFMLIWFCGWVFYSFRFLFMILMLMYGKDKVLQIGNQLASLMSGIFLLWGTFDFIKKKISPLFIYVTITMAAWIIFSVGYELSWMLVSLPPFTLLGFIYFWTGYILIRNLKGKESGGKLIGWTIILWGIHKIDYPFLRPVIWFAPIGYTLAAVLSMATALGMLIVYFQRVRHELIESEERFRTTYEHAGVGIANTWLDGQFFKMNPRFLEIVGYTDEELMNLRFQDITHPDDIEENVNLDKQLMEKKIDKFSMEKRYIRGDGALVWVYLTVSIIRNNSGEPKYFIAVIENITERKRAEEAIKNIVMGVSSQLGDKYFDSMVIHLANTLHADCTFIGELNADNLKSVRTLALSIDREVKDNFVYNLKASPYSDIIREGMCSCVSGVSSQFPEDQFINKIGIEGYIAVPLFDSKNSPLGIIVALYRKPIQDIKFAESILQIFAASTATEIERMHAVNELRKHRDNLEALVEERTEELLSANKSLLGYAEIQDTLLKEVNHRVKNNISALISILHMEEDRATKDGITLYMPILKNLIGRLQGLSMVHKMLSESGWKPLNLSSLTDEVIRAAIYGITDTSKIDIGIEYSDVKVTSNQAHNLTLVINELVTNTVKHVFKQKYSIKIKVNIRLTGNEIYYSYQDDGPGYSDEMLENYNGANIGFELIKGLVRKSIRGKMKISNDNGAKVELTFASEIDSKNGIS